MGGHLCGVLLPENGRRSFVNHCLEPRSKRRDRAELQANVRHFELSRKRIAARMRTCRCMSHFVYNLRSRPLVRDLAARVRGQIASDHCRSDLITGPTHWARAGYPFPEVNVPEMQLFTHHTLRDRRRWSMPSDCSNFEDEERAALMYAEFLRCTRYTRRAVLIKGNPQESGNPHQVSQSAE